jgi:alpha-mannosidase
VASHVTGLVLNPLGWLESVTDAGDTYTPSLRGAPVVARWSAPVATERGPLRATWLLGTRLERPRQTIPKATELAPTAALNATSVTVSATASMSLCAGADRIDITIAGENPAGDHRLRWVLTLPDGLRTDHVFADAAFGAVERVVDRRDPNTSTAERRLTSAPLHRWLWFSGEAQSFGVVSDGLAEYELLPDGCVAITLLRAVGELSRRDLPERPGHAGWPAETPLAQSQGPFAARVALVALPANRDDALVRLEQAADDMLLPLTGDTWRGVASRLADFTGLTLQGDGLAFSSAKRSECGQWLVLRCINQRAVPVDGVWFLPRDITEARVARLDETAGGVLATSGTQVAFEAAPHAIVTILVR